jgi:hypothetical protein
LQRRPDSLGRKSSLAAALSLAVSLAYPLGTRAEDGAGKPRFDFSGAQRTRYEALDPQFRSGFDASDDVLVLQTSLSFDYELEHLELHAEVMDSRGMLNDEHSFVTNVVNSLEPIQLFVAWRRKGLIQDGGESTLRFGRVTLDLGKRRILGRNRFRNTVNNFIGSDWVWRGADGRNARVFYLIPMQTTPNDTDSLLDNDAELDNAARSTRLYGGFYQLAPFGDESTLELYAMQFVAKSQADVSSDTNRLTIGSRVFRLPAPGAWSYEVEAMRQTGTAGGTIGGVTRPDYDAEAYFVHVEFGYQFDAALNPNLMFQYDRASGDADPNDDELDRFNPLFGPRRSDFGPTGIYGPFARSNIDSPGVRLTLAPAPRWQSMVSYRSYRLAQARDAWVGSGWRDATGQSGRSIGKQLEASFTWAAIKNRLSVETGFALLELGRFGREVQGTALRGNPRYFYAMVTTTF